MMHKAPLGGVSAHMVSIHTVVSIILFNKKKDRSTRHKFLLVMNLTKVNLGNGSVSKALLYSTMPIRPSAGITNKDYSGVV